MLKEVYELLFKMTNKFRRLRTHMYIYTCQCPSASETILTTKKVTTKGDPFKPNQIVVEYTEEDQRD